MAQGKTTLRESWAMRWAMLLLVSFGMATNYYFYDALSPLKDILTQQLGFSSTDYGFFMSAYSIPNVFLAMAVLGGIILDRIGIRITGTLFFGSMVLGSFLTYYGATDYFIAGGFGYAFFDSFLTSYTPSLKLMSLGFFMFGLGAETSCVVISKAVVKWFKGKELALALGINIAIARGGMAAAMIISPLLIAPEWTNAIFFGFVLLCSGTVAFLIYTFFDRKVDRQIVEADGEQEEEVFRLSDIGKLLGNRSFIFVALLCVTFYSAVFPFVKYAPDLMVNKFNMSVSLSGFIVTLLPFGNIVFTPLFGLVCDYKGYSATLMILGSTLLIVVHLLFSLTMVTPYVPMFILGVAFSLVPAAMWPSLAKIVDENRLGTAYGLMFSIQNIGLWLFPMLIGYVLDTSNPGVAPLKAGLATFKTVAIAPVVFITEHLRALVTYDYTNPILMLAGLGVVGMVFAFALKAADRKLGTDLEKPNKAAASSAAEATSPAAAIAETEGAGESQSEDDQGSA